MKKSNLMKVFTFIIIISTIIITNSLLVFGQKEDGSAGSNTATDKTGKIEKIEELITSLAKWWLTLFVIGIIIIVIGLLFRDKLVRVAKLMVTGGVFTIFIAIFLLEIAYILIPGRLPILGFKFDVNECEGIFKPLIESMQAQEDPIYNLIGMTSCILSGYTPSEISWLGITVFFIFSIIIPITILVSLFYYFSDFISHTGIRRVISFSAALLTYRALFSTLFIEFITYGLGGIGLLLINYLFFGWAMRWVRGMFAMVEMTKTLLTIQNLAEYNRLLEYRDELIRARDTLIRSVGNPDEIKKYDDLIEAVENKIKKLVRNQEQKDSEKISPPYIS
jgi:hypothetical protein